MSIKYVFILLIIYLISTVSTNYHPKNGSIKNALVSINVTKNELSTDKKKTDNDRKINDYGKEKISSLNLKIKPLIPNMTNNTTGNAPTSIKNNNDKKARIAINPEKSMHVMRSERSNREIYPEDDESSEEEKKVNKRHKHKPVTKTWHQTVNKNAPRYVDNYDDYVGLETHDHENIKAKSWKEKIGGEIFKKLMNMRHKNKRGVNKKSQNIRKYISKVKRARGIDDDEYIMESREDIRSKSWKSKIGGEIVRKLISSRKGKNKRGASSSLKRLRKNVRDIKRSRVHSDEYVLESNENIYDKSWKRKIGGEIVKKLLLSKKKNNKRGAVSSLRRLRENVKRIKNDKYGFGSAMDSFLTSLLGPNFEQEFMKTCARLEKAEKNAENSMQSNEQVTKERPLLGADFMQKIRKLCKRMKEISKKLAQKEDDEDSEESEEPEESGHKPNRKGDPDDEGSEEYEESEKQGRNQSPGDQEDSSEDSEESEESGKQGRNQSPGDEDSDESAESREPGTQDKRQNPGDQEDSSEDSEESEESEESGTQGKRKIDPDYEESEGSEESVKQHRNNRPDDQEDSSEDSEESEESGTQVNRKYDHRGDSPESSEESEESGKQGLRKNSGIDSEESKEVDDEDDENRGQNSRKKKPKKKKPHKKKPNKKKPNKKKPNKKKPHKKKPSKRRASGSIDEDYETLEQAEAESKEEEEE